MKLRNRVLGLVAAVAMGAGATSSVNAGMQLWNLTDEFSGATQPSGIFSVKLEDTGANIVTLTVTSGLVGTEFMGSLYLNYIPNTASSGLVINRVSGPGSAPGIGLGIDAFKADGDGLFDIKFDFDTAPPSDRMDNGAVSVFTITGASVADFLYRSAPDPLNSTAQGYPKDGLWVAAHIQGIGPNGDLSGWVTVPEPTTVVAGALLLLPFAASTMRFVRRKKA